MGINVNEAIKTRDDIIWLHLVRIFAVVCVLLIHVSAQIIYMKASVGSWDWCVAEVFNSLSRISVPLLFTVTGCLMVGGNDKWLSFINKRMRKILPPLFFWSLVYLALIHGYEAQHISGTSAMDAESLKRTVDAGWWGIAAILVMPVYYHLWFMYALILLYLTMTIWQKIPQHCSDKVIFVLLVVWLCVLVLEFFLGDYLSSPLFFFLNNMFGNVGFLLMGYMLSRVALTPYHLKLAWVGVVFGSAISLFGTYWLSVKDNEFNVNLFGNSPNIVIATAGVFYLFRHYLINWVPSPRTQSQIKIISLASFGVYLVHPLFLYVGSIGIAGIKMHALSTNPIVMVPLLTLLLYTLSHALVLLFMRSRWTRLLVGG